MRWMIWMATTIFVGACAGPIGSPPTPIDPAQPAAAPTIEVARFRADLPDLGEAPELNNKVWLNTDRPLRLADLRGKVVVLDMWTFG
jgi:hypothetical protein